MMSLSGHRHPLHPVLSGPLSLIIGGMCNSVGLIAGQGRLPVLTAEGIRASGRSVVCVGLSGQFDPALPPMCDRFGRAGIIRIGRWIRLLRRWGVHEAIMVGRVRKARMFQPLRVIRQLPDWRAARLWYRVLRHDRRNEIKPVQPVIANQRERLFQRNRIGHRRPAGDGLQPVPRHI